MPDPYLGEIRVFSCGFTPQGWAPCDGRTISISQNQALFSILGNRYGGDGVTTFALPNLSGRAPIHFGEHISLGQAAGEEVHTLTVDEMPSHSHTPMASNKPATEISPSANVWASLPNTYSNQSQAAMNPEAVSSAGKDMPHGNMQPYLVVNFCIALAGEFPPHS